MDVTLPDGTVIKDVPEGMTKADLTAKLKTNGYDVSKLGGEPAPAGPAPSRMDQFMEGLKNPVGGELVRNLAGGAVRGAAGIGATLQHYLNPMEWGNDAADKQRRTSIDQVVNENSDPNSLAFKNAKLLAEIGGTSGAGGLLGKGAQALGAAPSLVNALGSAGFTTGNEFAPTLLGRAADMGTRMLGGAASGGVSAGLVDPSTAGTGAVIGGLLPPGMKTLGAAGSAVTKPIARAITGGPVAPEVQDLAKRAAQLGIEIPADRIANSKPLNALASGLNYVPFSGRQAVEQRMQDQLNTAASKLVGQDSPNVTMALRKAQTDLGGKFESTLKNNTVNVDPQFLSDLADAANTASRELGSDGAGIIGKQVDDIVSKAATGEIDGKAAYNIKKTLDKIGNRNSSEAPYAIDLKKALMGALDRSLGPEEAAAFAQTRKQYGTMLDLDKIAQNGAEGDISIARLANMKNIGNKDLQELADISAQFLKPREGQHGAAQRAFAGMGLAGAGSLVGGPMGAAVGVGGTMLGGRIANSLLDSNLARSGLLQRAGTPGLLQQITDEVTPGLYRGLPRSGRQN